MLGCFFPPPGPRSRSCYNWSCTAGAIRVCLNHIAAFCCEEKLRRTDAGKEGISGPAMMPLADIAKDAWDELMSTNLKAVWMCMKYEIRAMLRQGKGSIVNVS